MIKHITPPQGWHTEQQAKMKTLDMDSLIYIRNDALETSELQWEFNPRAGMYRDTALYAGMEIKKRMDELREAKRLNDERRANG